MSDLVTNMEQNNLWHIGTFVNTFGIKGELKLLLNHNLHIYDLQALQLVFIQMHNQTWLPYQVTNCRQDKHHLVLKLAGLDHINDVLAFKNTNVYLQRDTQVFELITPLHEYQVWYKQEEWLVTDVMSNGAYDLIKIKHQSTHFWVPLVDKYVLHRDDQQHIITLQALEELK